MLTRWLTFTAFLAGSANPERAALTVAPTCRVKGHLEAELTLNCGDGKSAGVVQYWHTPFGELQTPGVHSELDSVFVHRDGSLVVPNTSVLHMGLYYCVLQHAEGTTLWPYQLHISRGNHQQNQEHGQYGQHCSRGAFRFRRDAGSEEERRAGVSDGEFAGAVAASVLLTFVLGFSTGALTRTHVLRCLRTISTRLRSPRQQRCHTDRLGSGSEVTMTTLPPMYDNHTFEVEPAGADDSANSEITISSTTSSPPVKPQRSLRIKQPEEQETTAYLEGCDYTREEEGRMEEQVAGRSLEDKIEGCVGEEEDGELSGFYPLGEEDGGSQTKTEEDECSEDGGQRREAKQEWRQEEEVEVEQKNSSREDGEEGRGSEEVEAGGNKEKGRDEKREEEEGDDGETREEDEETEKEDAETGHEKQEDTKTAGGGGGGGASSSPPRPGRRSRVIRLYQYDEDGRRYGHLPDPAPENPGPAPRLRQRSVSLTRLNAIMAAASAGPLDTGGTGREERPHFQMEI